MIFLNPQQLQIQGLRGSFADSMKQYLQEMGIERTQVSTLVDYVSRHTYLDWTSKAAKQQLLYALPINRLGTADDDAIGLGRLDGHNENETAQLIE